MTWKVRGKMYRLVYQCAGCAVHHAKQVVSPATGYPLQVVDYGFRASLRDTAAVQEGPSGS